MPPLGLASHAASDVPLGPLTPSRLALLVPQRSCAIGLAARCSTVGTRMPNANG
jgi:hypothetical protein